MGKKKKDFCNCPRCLDLAALLIEHVRELGISPGAARNAFALAADMIDVMIAVGDAIEKAEQEPAAPSKDAN